MAKSKKNKRSRQKQPKSAEDREQLRQKREYVARLRHRDGMHEHRFWILKNKEMPTSDNDGLHRFDGEFAKEVKDDILVYKFLHTLRFIHCPGVSGGPASFYFYDKAPVWDSEDEDNEMEIDGYAWSAGHKFVPPTAEDPFVICDCPQVHASLVSSTHCPTASHITPLMHDSDRHSAPPPPSPVQQGMSGETATMAAKIVVRPPYFDVIGDPTATTACLAAGSLVCEPSVDEIGDLSRATACSTLAPTEPSSVRLLSPSLLRQPAKSAILGIGGPETLQRVLDARRSLRQGEVMSYLDCKALAPFRGTNYTMWISSPNMGIIPEPPMYDNTKTLTYFRDGHLGVIEYTKWPQGHYEQEPHCMAIPANPYLLSCLGEDQSIQPSTIAVHPSMPGIEFQDPAITWMDIDSESFVTEDMNEIIMVGRLRDDILRRLCSACAEIVTMTNKVAEELFLASPLSSPTGSHKYLEYYNYQQARIRNLGRARCQLMEVPVSSFNTLMWFREAQRILLDLRGWLLYVKIVLLRWADSTFELASPGDVLPVRGVFTTNVNLVADMFRIGVPVWYVREADTLTTSTAILAVREVLLSNAVFSGSRTMCHLGRSRQAPLVGHATHESRMDLHDRVRRMAWTTLPRVKALEEYIRAFPSVGEKRIVEEEISAIPTHDDNRDGHRFDLNQDSDWSKDFVDPATVQTFFRDDVSKSTSLPSVTALPDKSQDQQSKTTPSRADAIHGFVSRSPWHYMRDQTTYGGGAVVEVKSTGDELASLGNLRPAWAPKISPGWTEALAKFSDGKVVTVRFQYPIPPPHMFFGTRDDAVLGSKFHNWIRIRSWCLNQVLGPPAQKRVCMGPDEWRVALEGRYFATSFDKTEFPGIQGPVSSSADIAKLPAAPPLSVRREPMRQDRGTHKQSEKAKRHRAANVVRQARRIDVNVRFAVHAGFSPHNPKNTYYWGRTPVSFAVACDDRVLQAEVVWELSVLNFRLEFISLDRHLQPEIYACHDQRAATERESAICAIWNSGCVRPLWDMFPDEVDPFSLRSMETRENLVVRMADVVATWPEGALALQRYQKSDRRDNQQPQNSFEDFEHAVFTCYVHLFRKAFGRLPTVPLYQPSSLKSRCPSSML